MEKRTFLFLFAVAVSFFLINFFFQYQNQEKVEQWNLQQKAQKEQKIKQLQAEIVRKTAKPGDLPLMEIFAEAEGKELLATGVSDKHSIIALTGQPQPLEAVFARKEGSTEKPVEYHLIAASEHPPLLLYTKGLPEKLLIGDLPDFGKFDLQVVSLHKNPQVYVADYIDGHLSIPFEQIRRLQLELGSTAPAVKIPSGIALLKTVSGYLPVAFYDGQTHELVNLDEVESLSNFISKPQEKEAITSNALTEEKFYVLQNEYQQLVFSNYGGALVEINLPFESKTDNESVVREIAFDREMVKDHPYNAHFPSHPYYTPGKLAQGPYEEHIEGQLGGFYPLIRRDLIESPRRKTVRIPPRFYALNIVSEYPEVAEQVYQVKKFDKNSITFEAKFGHRQITKTFSIASEEKGAPYSLELTLSIDGDSRGLWLTSGIPEVEWISGAPAPSLKYRITRNHKPEVNAIELPKDALTNTSLYPDWVSNSNGFLGLILNPVTMIDPGYRAQHIPGTQVPSRLVLIGEEFQRFKAQDLPGYMLLLPLNSKGGTMRFHVFAGPYENSALEAVDRFYSDPATGYNPDFIASQTFHGWFAFISEPFAKFLFILMRFFYSLTHSWAFSIVLLTVALRLMLYPLNAWSTKSMLSMQKIAPEVTAIQERHKKDPKKAQLEIMQLYRDRQINPMSGCLPLLIQMPFLIGMFDLLKSSFVLRGASFIPGWIDDLTAPDVLFSWHTPLFFIGNQFHLLPIILGVVMFVQQRMMSTLPPDPKQWTDQQRQQRAMGSMMAVVFAIMFYNFPSGLNIYWLSSLLLGILQQWWTQRQMNRKKT